MSKEQLVVNVSAVEQNASTANKDIPLKQNLSKMNAVFVLCDCHNLTGAQNSEIILTMTWQGIEFSQWQMQPGGDGKKHAPCQFQGVTALPQQSRYSPVFCAQGYTFNGKESWPFQSLWFGYIDSCLCIQGQNALAFDDKGPKS